LVRRQHGVISHRQLREHGFTGDAIRHRLKRGRLHRTYRGVYAVGRPDLPPEGRWMAAVLAAGEGAVLSHRSAIELWGLIPGEADPTARRRIHVSIPAGRHPRRAGMVTHRRSLADEDVTERRRVPVTGLVLTLLDLAAVADGAELERAVNRADKLELIDPDTLRDRLEARSGTSGVAKLRQLLDRETFRLTDSELERRFLRLARRAGLPPPETQARIAGLRVDFYWPTLRLVVETDGLRYHRTPVQQARDRRRDQTLTAIGLATLRFTHRQVRYEPARVIEVLMATAARRGGPAPPRRVERHPRRVRRHPGDVVD
jgi:very-short-patch-repair endonuclease